MEKIDYIPNGNEYHRIERYVDRKEPVVIVGPTGCGKTTLVQHLAEEKERILETVLCSSDMTPRHLIGGFNLERNYSVWNDGPLTRSVKQGSIFYMDELDQAPAECLATLFSLLDHRRELYLSALACAYPADEKFQFVASYNPKSYYLGQIPPAFRQRCCFVRLDYLPMKKEIRLLCEFTGIPEADAEFLVNVGRITRQQSANYNFEGAGTRLLLLAARSLAEGIDREDVVMDHIVFPLSDDLKIQKTILKALEAVDLMTIDNIEQFKPEQRLVPDIQFEDSLFYEAQ